MTRRSALPLPRYVLRKPSKAGGWAFFFNPPMWARAAGCPVKVEALGTDYRAAVLRAETILLPQLDVWRDGEDAAATIGRTLDWVFAEYRADRRFADSMSHQAQPRVRFPADWRIYHEGWTASWHHAARRDHDRGDDCLREIADRHRDRRRWQRGRARAPYHCKSRDEILPPCMECRGTTNPGKLPLVNPFAQMGLQSSDRETPTATYDELQEFRAKAIEMGLPSLATAALITWDWLQREIDIFATFDVTHYRPKERPNAVRVLHEKTNEENWIPLFDDTGVPLYPELMLELDAIKRDRIGGLMLTRDWGDRRPGRHGRRQTIPTSRT